MAVGAKPAYAVAALAAAGLLAVTFLGAPDPEPGYRKYKPGMKIASDEEVIMVTASGSGHVQGRSSHEKIHVHMEINGHEEFNGEIDNAPRTWHYVLVYGSDLRIDVRQAYIWGEIGCAIHKDQFMVDSSSSVGNLGSTVSCSYNG